MSECTFFTEPEVRRLTVIHQTFAGLSARSAAPMLKLSARQVFRLKAKVRTTGDMGIRHGNCGRQPHNAKPQALRQQVLDLFQTEFSKYNACHFAEALAEEKSIKLSPDSIRRWLRAAGVPPKHRHRSQGNHRRRRERRARFGELVFIDGSPHPWFGINQPPSTLILATDDATGMPLHGRFDREETLAGCFNVFYHVGLRYGIPAALYLDHAGQFTTTRHGGTHLFQRDDKPTHFEIAMHSLAVELIFANSPQARGRGERINGSLQDRLVAELDHHQITDPEKATDYLNRVFIPKYAKRFGVKPRDPKQAFRSIPEGLDLRTVLCAKSTREVQNDNTISYHGCSYQLKPNTRSFPIAGSQVNVQEWFDGSIHVRHERAGTIPVTHTIDRPRPQRPPKRTPYDVFAAV
ncbi:ISNCY family transposase [candidate division WOR-3 bacterium]|uniref:ISNCY family transposase n=1 Tax=candidate division WOR-3 bacterium TaxID=2052148 RepID=A0A937XCC6_UNCW3|nr:ISNCY family transposase [candidate division WOR-3 bacterium]